MKLVYLLLILSSLSCKAGHDTLLHPIIENGKFGFINSKGVVVVEPQFLSAGEFAEGLAPVRIEGCWGYIDVNGKVEISADFDYALPFSEGFAVVFVDGKPQYINKQGREPFKTPFNSINSFSDGLAEINTVSGKIGYINTSGNLIIDTIYKSIGRFVDGLAIVEGVNHGKKSAKGVYKTEVGVINKEGKIIVPFGKFDAIKDYKNGYASFSINEQIGDETGETAKSGFIDRKGKVVLSRNNTNNTWIQGDISEGLAIISLYKHWLPESKEILFSADKSYEGYINLKGEIILNDTTLVDVTEFSEGRAFVSGKFEDAYLIDASGKRVSQNTFKQVWEKGYISGHAFVQKDYKWGIINRSGEFIVKPTFDEIEENIMNKQFFAFSEEVKDEKGMFRTKYGIADLKGKVVVKPVLDDFNRRGFINGLLRVYVDGLMAYVDSAGKEIWKAKKMNNNGLQPLNIDVMNRGYFYASQSEDHEDYNGWGGSYNTPRKTSYKREESAVIVVIDTTKSTIYQERYKGYTLSVINATGKVVSFNAQDSRLQIKLQAMDRKGEWRDIEYLPSSWCGNSYHIADLKTSEEWTFSIPQYTGSLGTKIRAALTYIDPKSTFSKEDRQRKEVTVYSNVISGSVNPGQFWRKGEYQSAGIMDPYNE